MVEKLTQLEKCWLVVLFSDGYRYLVRDGFGKIWAHQIKPKRKGKRIVWFYCI